MKQLLHDTVESCQKYMPKLIKAIEEVSCQLHSSNESKALARLPQIFEGLQWVLDAIQEIQKFYNILEVNVEDLTVILKELEQAIKSRDYVLMADLFEYEIKPVLKKWLDEVNSCNGVKQ